MCHLLSWNNCDHFCSGCIPHSHLKLTLCHKNSQHWHTCVHCHVWLFKIHVNYFKLSHATKFSTNILFIPKLHSLCCCKKTLSLTCNITLHSEVTDFKFLKQIDIWHTLPLLLDKLPKSTEKPDLLYHSKDPVMPCCYHILQVSYFLFTCNIVYLNI